MRRRYDEVATMMRRSCDEDATKIRRSCDEVETKLRPRWDEDTTKLRRSYDEDACGDPHKGVKRAPCKQHTRYRWGVAVLRYEGCVRMHEVQRISRNCHGSPSNHRKQASAVRSHLLSVAANAELLLPMGKVTLAPVPALPLCMPHAQR